MPVSALQKYAECLKYSTNPLEIYKMQKQLTFDYLKNDRLAMAIAMDELQKAIDKAIK